MLSCCTSFHICSTCGWTLHIQIESCYYQKLLQSQKSHQATLKSQIWYAQYKWIHVNIVFICPPANKLSNTNSNLNWPMIRKNFNCKFRWSIVCGHNVLLYTSNSRIVQQKLTWSKKVAFFDIEDGICRRICKSRCLFKFTSSKLPTKLKNTAERKNMQFLNLQRSKCKLADLKVLRENDRLVTRFGSIGPIIKITWIMIMKARHAFKSHRKKWWSQKID